MKNLILTVILLIILTTTANAWTINGIETSKFKLHPVKATGGVIASALIHCMGHYTAAAMMGKTMHQEGFHEIWHGEYTRSEEAWIGRSGFIAQLTVGFIFNKLDFDESFKIGFNAMSMVEIVSYPFINNNQKRRDNGTGASDIGNIEASGNAFNEMILYTGISIYNLNNSFK